MPPCFATSICLRLRGAAASSSPLSLSSFAECNRVQINTLPTPRSTRAARMQLDSGENNGPTVDAEVRSVGVPELKRELLNCVNGTDRGFAASGAKRVATLTLVQQLEDAARAQPYLPGGDTDALVGTWRLVFTNALDVLSLGVLPFVQVGQIFQNVAAGEVDGEGDYVLENIVELEPILAPITNAFDAIGATKSRVIVTAKGTASAGTRVDIVFVKSKIEGVSLFGRDTGGFPCLEVPINSPVGYIETTFIDEEMRIAVAPPTPNAPQRANVFVLLREE
jgi:hypothetical protein